MNQIDTARAARAAVMDEIHERRGHPISRGRQFEIRAFAVADARERLGLTGAARRQSLENEQELIKAAMLAWSGINVRINISGQRCERTGQGGLASVTELPIVGAGLTPKLYGYAARFNEPTTILSSTEGHFVERVARTAFTRSLRSNRRLRSYFNHGRDNLMGQRPLGPVTAQVDEYGLRYEVSLLDDPSVGYVEKAARAGLLGSSFAFEVQKDQWRRPSSATPENPEALAERLLIEVDLFELGPVTSPAYANTDVGVRSAKGDLTHKQSMRTPAHRAAALRAIQLAEIGARRPR